MKHLITLNYVMCAIMMVITATSLALGLRDIALTGLVFGFLNLFMVYHLKRIGY